MPRGVIAACLLCTPSVTRRVPPAHIAQRHTSPPHDCLCAPQIESVAYTHSLKELTLLVNTQQAITKDNVTIRIDGVLYIRIVDPFKASYGVDNPLYAVMQLAQTSMRSELGKMTLDNTFEERDALNDKIVQARDLSAS